MALYNQSIYEIEACGKAGGCNGCDSVVVLPKHMIGYKDLTLDDLIFSASTGKTCSGKYKIVYNSAEYKIEIQGCCSLRICNVLPATEDLCGYFVAIDDADMNKVVDHLKGQLKELFDAAANHGTYVVPQDMKCEDIALLLIYTFMLLDRSKAIPSEIKAHFAATLWTEAVDPISNAPMVFLAAKDMPSKVVLTSCIGNIFALPCAPCIRPGAILDFSGIMTKKYKEIIDAVRGCKLNCCESCDLRSRTTADNFTLKYDEYARINELDPTCGQTLLVIDIISMLYNSKLTGSSYTSPCETVGFILKMCSLPKYISTLIERMRSNSVLYNKFKEESMYENSCRLENFNSRYTSVFETAVLEYKRRTELTERAASIVTERLEQMESMGGGKLEDRLKSGLVPTEILSMTFKDATSAPLANVRAVSKEKKSKGYYSNMINGKK